MLRLAQLVFVGPDQVNCRVPAAPATGRAQITVTSRSSATATTAVEIASVVPSIFTMPGGRVAAAVAVRGAADGTQTNVPVFQCSASSCSATPIDLAMTTDTVVVVFFGTGLRKNSGVSNVHAAIGGVDAPVLFAGAQNEFPGLDQLNVQIPASLRGRGEVPVVFTIDGQQSNSVNIAIR